MDNLAHRKEAVIRFQQGCREDPHAVEEFKVAILHGKDSRLVHDATKRLSPRLLIHDLTGECGRTPEQIPVFSGDADPCHLDDDSHNSLLTQGLILDLVYQVHEVGWILLADETPPDQDVVAFEEQGILCLV